MIDPQLTLASHLTYSLTGVMEIQQITHSLFLVDFTLENQIAVLSICLPPSRCIGTVSGRDRLAAVLAFLSSALQAQALGSRRGAKGIRLQWKMGKCVQS